jgi:hypothetical protein
MLPMLLHLVTLSGLRDFSGPWNTGAHQPHATHN